MDWAKDVLYNAAGQITQMKYSQDTSGSSYYTETRTFNVLQQLTRLTVPGVLDHEYRFSLTQNNGRITQRKDWISGEEISYQYDSLNRLISAATTGPQWGQSFTYDGFGNMLSQTVTKGQAPSLSANVDPATNWITTGGANGNLTAMPLLTVSCNVHFGRKLIYTQSYPEGPVIEDRLASTVKHFPYGEEPSTTNQNRMKFATYYRDATTALDYAQQRYYARTIGRFTSPDPLGGSLADPQSLNRYAYVVGDPVNGTDPSGLAPDIIIRIFVTGWGIPLPGFLGEHPISMGADPRKDAAYVARLRALSGQTTGSESGGSTALRWVALSTKCRNGLEAAMSQGRLSQRAAVVPRLLALDRALAAKDVLMKAAAGPIGWEMLAAIGIRESGFENKSEVDGAGVGVGVFQITVGNKTGVTAKDAGNLAWAATWAAETLSKNYAILHAKFPNFNEAQLLQATAASLNFGPDDISGNPNTIDVGSKKGNYGSNIMNLMDCFD